MAEYIDLRPGIHISVQKDAGALDAAFVSTIRHVSPVAVRMDVPRRGSEPMELAADDDLMIMVDLSGRLYTFATRVQRMEDSGDAVLIDRPRIVEKRDQAIPRLPTIGLRFRF